MFLPLYFLNVGGKNPHRGHSTHLKWWPNTEACRKNWRSDKNEEGQPFFTFTKLHYRHPCWLLQCIKKTVIHSFHWFLFIRNCFQVADIYLHTYIFAYTHIYVYSEEIIILYYLLKFFIKINLSGGKCLFKNNEVTSEDQNYPSYLNLIRNISVASYSWKRTIFDTYLLWKT